MFFTRPIVFLLSVYLLGLCSTYAINTPTYAQAPLIKKILPNLSEATLSTPSESTQKSISPEISYSIEVKGNIFSSSDDIIAASKLSSRNTISPLHLSKAKNNIKKLGIFNKINIEISEITKDITIYVEENPTITDIQLIGNSIYTESFLNNHLQSKPNQPFNLSLIRNDIQFIDSQYKKDGYLEAKVIRIEKPTSSSGRLLFHIAEGVISDIVITGNIKTKDYVILRELEIRPGDLINEKDIRRNIRKIFNLNYFENIIPEFLPSETPYHFTLKLNFVERENSGAFTFGGSFQPNNGFSLMSDLYWDNLMGTGKLIMIKGNFGLATSQYNNRNNTYQIKYRNPWAFGNNRSLTFRLWSSTGSFSAFNLGSGEYSFEDTSRKGIDAEFGIPHTYDFRTSHRFKYESVNLEEYNQQYNLYTYTLRITYDKRDQRLNPTKGVFHNLTIEQGFKFRPQAIDLTRTNLSLRKFFNVFTNQVVFLKAKLGYIRSPDINNEEIFSDEYYYVGGSQTVRGYPDNKPFAYGDKQFVGTAEYRYIFNTNVTAYGFIDVGYASKFRQDDDTFESKNFFDLSEYKLTKGIGVKFIIQPLGPIRLDFGITEKGIGRLQFNLGYSF